MESRKGFEDVLFYTGRALRIADIQDIRRELFDDEGHFVGAIGGFPVEHAIIRWVDEKYGSFASLHVRSNQVRGDLHNYRLDFRGDASTVGYIAEKLGKFLQNLN